MDFPSDRVKLYLFASPSTPLPASPLDLAVVDSLSLPALNMDGVLLLGHLPRCQELRPFPLSPLPTLVYRSSIRRRGSHLFSIRPLFPVGQNAPFSQSCSAAPFFFLF